MGLLYLLLSPMYLLLHSLVSMGIMGDGEIRCPGTSLISLSGHWERSVCSPFGLAAGKRQWMQSLRGWKGSTEVWAGREVDGYGRRVGHGFKTPLHLRTCPQKCRWVLFKLSLHIFLVAQTEVGCTLLHHRVYTCIKIPNKILHGFKLSSGYDTVDTYEIVHSSYVY